MKRLAALLGLIFLSFLLVAQEPAPPTDKPKAAQATPREQAEPAAAQPNESAEQHGSLAQQLAEASSEAAGEKDETAQFKESPSVHWIASLTGLSMGAAYWGLVGLNFAVIALLIFFASKTKIPAMFRSRTAAIKQNLEEARQASTEAQRRLGDIEQRLSKLDVEIAAMRSAAEADAAAEEARIRSAAEEDKQKVVEMAEQEIAAATRSARRELKSYVADLAVTLAQRRMQVDAKTDQALVHSFVAQLGAADNDSGKEKR